MGQVRAEVASHGAIHDEAALDAAVLLLATQDPELVAHLVAVAGPPPLRRREPGLEGLAAIVVSQQVSTASAAAIFARLRAALDPFEADVLAHADDALLRGVGLSGAKVRTLRAIAAAVLEGGLCFRELARLPAEEAVARLVAVHGIGPWTAQSFLLFCLGHPDAWPAGDLALQEAARVALRLEARPDAVSLGRIAERWRPYRGVAARLLWNYYRALKARDGTGLAER